MKTNPLMESEREPERRSARDRLLAAASELFYEEGINTVGIDRVIAHAGVAKASLYSSFGSKEALIGAYLNARHDARKARMEAKLATYGDPRERLLGVFDAMKESMAEPNFRGCAFVRAGAEVRPGSSVKIVCDDARGWMRELFTGLARDADAPDPQALAQQLVLLYDGASVSAQLEGGTGAAVTARAAAGLMLDAALAARPSAPAGKRAGSSSKRSV